TRPAGTRTRAGLWSRQLHHSHPCYLISNSPRASAPARTRVAVNCPCSFPPAVVIVFRRAQPNGAPRGSQPRYTISVVPDLEVASTTLQVHVRPRPVTEAPSSVTVTLQPSPEQPTLKNSAHCRGDSLTVGPAPARR